MQQMNRKYCRGPLGASAIALLISLFFSMNGFSQTAETFDINRYSTLGAGMFITYYVDDTRSLKTVLEDGIVTKDTELLVTKTAAGNVALIRDQMAFHHIAQGLANGLEWMATF